MVTTALEANGAETRTSAPRTCATSILLNESIEPAGYMSKPAAAAAVTTTKTDCFDMVRVNRLPLEVILETHHTLLDRPT